MDAEVLARLAEWDRFFDLTSDKNRLVLAEYYRDPEAEAGAMEMDLLWPENAIRHAEWALHAYADQMRRTAWLKDDAIPHVNLLSGTEIFAECFGCPVIRKRDSMPFARHAVSDISEARRIKKPKLMDTPLRLQFEKADWARRREPEALLHLPDIQSPLDVAALVWEKGDFYCAMLEEPQAVHGLIEICCELICDFLDEWFARYGTDMIAHYPNYPMRGGITLSEDEIGVINRELFEEFSLPYLNRLSRRYGGIGIHSCADCRHQLPSLKKVEGLRMLNLNQPSSVHEEALTVLSGWTAFYPMGLEDAVLRRPEYRKVHAALTLNAGGMNRDQLTDALAEKRQAIA